MNSVKKFHSNYFVQQNCATEHIRVEKKQDPVEVWRICSGNISDANAFNNLSY